MVKGALAREAIPYTLIDVDCEPNKASEANVRGLPTLIFYEDDIEKHRIVGNPPELLKKLKELGYDRPSS
jgi:hypothetical protein